MWRRLWIQIRHKGWRRFEVHVRKTQYYWAGVTKSDLGESSEMKGESWKGSLYLLREYINNHKQIVEMWLVKGILMRS